VKLNAGAAGMAAILVFLSSPVQAEYQHLEDESAMTAQQRELLNQDAAREYMVTIINRDRATVGSPPVVLDLGVPTKAGQMHSDEMAINGYLSHWTMDGRKPDQRYTDEGGRDAVAENAFTSLEGSAAEETGEPRKLELHSSQVFHRYELDNIEGDYFNEKPPHDGHRITIINPFHTSVGIGLSFASGFGAGIRTACTQEFVTDRGDFGEIPRTLFAGEKFPLTGKLQKGVTIKSIDLRFEEAPKPMTIAQLNKTSSYGMPDKVVASYFPVPDQPTDMIKIKSTADGDEFSVEISTDKEWQPGLYYLCVWADVIAGKEEALISTRTFTLTAAK
jgi:hypothetical protein